MSAATHVQVGRANRDFTRQAPTRAGCRGRRGLTAAEDEPHIFGRESVDDSVDTGLFPGQRNGRSLAFRVSTGNYSPRIAIKPCHPGNLRRNLWANWRLRKGEERANSCGVARLMHGQSRSLLALEPVQYSLASFFGRGLRPISGKTNRYFHALPPQGSSLPLRPTSVPATRSWLSCSVLVLASPLFLARSSSRFRDGRAEPTPAPRPFRQTLLGAFGETRSCRPVIADARAGDPRVLMVGAAESAPRRADSPQDRANQARRRRIRDPRAGR